MTWQDDAACLPYPTDLWFSNYPTRALAICAGCPVRQECLDDALATERTLGVAYVYGIHGGKTANERKRMIRGDKTTNHGPHNYVEFDPLEAYLARSNHDDDGMQSVRCGTPRRMTDGAIALQVGVTRESVRRWRGATQLMRHQAQRVADRLGVPFSEIWGKAA